MPYVVRGADGTFLIDGTFSGRAVLRIHNSQVRAIVEAWALSTRVAAFDYRVAQIGANFAVIREITEGTIRYLSHLSGNSGAWQQAVDAKTQLYVFEAQAQKLVDTLTEMTEAWPSSTYQIP